MSELDQCTFAFLEKLRKSKSSQWGQGLRSWRVLRKIHGVGRWRKLKGVALIEFPDGTVKRAEIHWYEAHGVGKKEFKVKRLLD